jgi:phage-related protein
MKGHLVVEPWLTVHIYELARIEIQSWPIEIKKDLGSILTRLQKGELVGYPDIKPMNQVMPGAFEVRLKDGAGAYRAFFVKKTVFGILVFHSFRKKSRKTPYQEIETGKRRFKTFMMELGQ